MDPLEYPHEISLHAMAGQVVPRTLKIHARIAGQRFQTLIDSGRTHNFLQERVAKYVGLPITTSPHFSVLVGNGQSMVCGAIVQSC